jgi:HemY protein
MKRSVLLLTALALLLLAAALAPIFKNDPGLVQIHFADWTIETSVLVLAGAFILLWLVVQTLIRMYRLPAETARRVQDKRALVQLEKGLLALTEGDWRTAEKALAKSTSSEGRNTARYLAAAQAAHGQEALERSDYYLEQADSGGRKRKFLVELTRARMLMDSGRRADALPILKDLQQRRPGHPQVLGLLARCLRELALWDELQKLLPVLLKKDVLNMDEHFELQIEICGHQVADADDAEALQQAWKALPKAMRREPQVIGIYSERAGELERADLAEPVLRASLKQAWNPQLVLRYGDPGADDAAKRLKQCEKWLEQHPDEPALHMALGRLCAGQELWGKAKHHLIRSLEIEPTSTGYDALGQLLERQGELELAMACFRNALKMTQGHAPEPLPRDPGRLAAPELPE